MVNGEQSSVNALSQAAIGRAMNLSRAAITKLKKQGMPVDSVESALAWRVARQNVAARKALPPEIHHMVPKFSAPPPPFPPVVPANDESHDQARTRREIAEANLAELKLAELRGALVRTADVRAAYAKRVAAARQALLQMPSRVIPLIIADISAAAIDRTLKREISAILESALRVES